jgi:uncharacterized integral membrane protein
MRFLGLLIILVIALVVLVVFAGQNNQAITVALFQYRWQGVAAWVPVAVAAAGVAVLFLLYLLLAATTGSFQRASMRRRINDLEGRVARYEDERRVRERGGVGQQPGAVQAPETESRQRVTSARTDETPDERTTAGERPVAPMQDQPAAGERPVAPEDQRSDEPSP